MTEANPGETFVGSKKQAFRTMEYSKNLDREPFKPLRINYFRLCIIDYLKEFIPQPPPHHHHPSVPYVQFVGGPHVLLHLNRKDIELFVLVYAEDRSRQQKKTNRKGTMCKQHNNNKKSSLVKSQCFEKSLKYTWKILHW